MYCFCLYSRKKVAKLKAEANEIKLNAELESQRIVSEKLSIIRHSNPNDNNNTLSLSQKREGELAFLKRQNELKVERATKLASIQVIFQMTRLQNILRSDFRLRKRCGYTTAKQMKSRNLIVLRRLPLLM